MARVNISSGSPFEPTIGISRAVQLEDRVLVSGTGPVWPDGHCDPDAEAQAERCFEIIATALAQAGCGLGDVVRTRMYLTSVDDVEAVSRVHSRFMGETRPAATMVVVSAFVDPRWKVEIEAEAAV